MKYVCIHGHFYQPDRVHPTTGQINPEPSAAPYPNWNARIFSECYGVNASMPLASKTQNNYHHINADFGPTLLRWLEKEKPHTYKAITEKRDSSAQNAIAQGYHHTILPLAHPRDVETEIIWGIRDFESRFGYFPQGFWLPETAANLGILSTLVRLGIRYIILSPNQASEIQTPEGQTFTAQELSAHELSQRPYRIKTPEGSITAFFYHRQLAQAVAFDGVLHDGQQFAQAIIHETTLCEPDSIVHFATDGESYGHHHKLGNLALGHIIKSLNEDENVILTSYDLYLEKHPATWSATIHENSSWSCAHGVRRWKEHCGCQGGGKADWSQSWRSELREALDWLRDQLSPLFEQAALQCLKNPWEARNDYIEIVLNREPQVLENFFQTHQKPGHDESREYILSLLEMQRHLLNMYTSCGWFFEDIARLEPLQNIRHALEASRLGASLLDADCEKEFKARMHAITSNQPDSFEQELNRLFHQEYPMEKDREQQRQAGVLLHLSSLPGDYAIGDLGIEARQFVDWLVRAGVTTWQYLPLAPAESNGSCYSSWSSLSGNPWLIDLRELHQEGFITDQELESCKRPALAHTDFQDISIHKQSILERAAERLLSDDQHPWQPAWARFKAQATWAENAGLFRYLKALHHGLPWWQWPESDRHPKAATLKKHLNEGKASIDTWMVLEFFFERQFNALRQYCEARSIKLLGDIAMYVAGDSVDVWRQQHLFCLDQDGMPLHVAGAPPDDFNREGQRWGNPVYDWGAMEKDGYVFWKERFLRGMQHADLIRFDHFRGLESYWAIPACEPTARNGRWVKGPGKKLFDVLTQELGELPLVVEDLGDIDDAVCELRDALAYPGMTVLQFGFSQTKPNEHTPCHYRDNTVVYTGTHDCDTTLGWWLQQPEDVKDRVRRYCSSDGEDIVWDFIRMALSSVAQRAIIPMQDILSLGNDARMNTPGTVHGNWSWRLDARALASADHKRLREMITLFAR